MTDNDTLLSELTDESSRRSFMKKSAIASGGLAMGLGGGTVAAQDGNQGDAMRGLMFNSQFHPRARFQIVSEAIDWAPVESDQDGDNFLTDANDNLLFSNPNVFGQFNTRVVNYQIGRQAWGLLFVHESADVEQGQTYQLSPTFTPFGTDDFQQFGISNADDDLFVNGGNELGLVTVQFSPASGGGGGGTPQGGNETAGNETAGNETAGNETAGNETA